jgi:hypothetical protein
VIFALIVKIFPRYLYNQTFICLVFRALSSYICTSYSYFCNHHFRIIMHWTNVREVSRDWNIVLHICLPQLGAASLCQAPKLHSHILLFVRLCLLHVFRFHERGPAGSVVMTYNLQTGAQIRIWNLSIVFTGRGEWKQEKASRIVMRHRKKRGEERGRK